MPCFTARAQEAAAQAEEIVSLASWGLKTLEERKGALWDCRHCALSAQRCLRSFLVCFYKGLCTFLCLCTFSPTFICWPLARAASLSLWLSGRWDFHGCSQGLTEERQCQKVTYKHRPCHSLAPIAFSFPRAVSTWGQREMPRFLWGLNSVWYSTWHNSGPWNRNVSC